ncbi:MAG: transketolase [Candidatus Roizmanbacteria bacterium]|nr:transketolase [Candidatus Roizmanbacteria bacterium]
MSDVLMLKNLAKRIRRGIIVSTTAAGSGHPTSSLSATELTTVLFFGGFLKQNITNFQNQFNDKFVLSKGHAAPLLYSIYEAAGVLSQSELMTLRKFNSHLQGHPTPELPFVDVTTGSLGQGLSVGLGMALGIRLKIKELQVQLKQEPTVWVLLGDSEMAEGQVWEAMEIASYYNVNNLIGIVDINRLGQSGETDLGWDIETYKKRIETFGWNVLEIKNGHNIEEIKKVFIKANTLNTVHSQKPTMILARTIKGKGVPFLEDKPGWQ